MNEQTIDQTVDAAVQPPPQEVDESVMKEIAWWEKELKRAHKADEDKFGEIKKCRAYMKGKPEADDNVDDSETVRANLVYATYKTLLPHIYAKNPEIDVSPSEAVSPEIYEGVRNFSKTLEICINKQLSSAKFKKVAKRCTLAGYTTPVGWVKAIYQRDYGEDPVILNRINDTQDNIARLQALVEQTKDSQECDEYHAKMEELKQQVAALSAQAEVVLAEGMAYDPIQTEDVTVCADVDLMDYQRSPWISHGIWYTVDDAATEFGLTKEDVQQCTKFMSKDHSNLKEASGSTPSGKADDTKVYYVRVEEIWHHRANTVKTLILGMKRWAREPYQPQRLGKHWYPLFPLIQNPLDGERWPMSDVEMLLPLTDEYNETRTNFKEHRERAIPARVGRKDDLSEEDAAKICEPGRNELVLIDGPDDPKVPVQNSVGLLQYAPIDPALYDTTQIRIEMDNISGVPESERAAVTRAKTLGEAELMQQGLVGRTGERQDTIEDWLLDLCEYTAEIILQEMTLPQVQRIAGTDAVWPQMSKEDVLNLVQIDIRAGSTGKPNKAREQKIWLELMPLMQKSIDQIMMLRMKGLTALAEGQVELLRETLNRFDERLDVERFLPLSPGGDTELIDETPVMGAGGMMPGMMPDQSGLTQAPGIGDLMMQSMNPTNNSIN